MYFKLKNDPQNLSEKKMSSSRREYFNFLGKGDSTQVNQALEILRNEAIKQEKEKKKN